jgi:hypothetical protein
VKNFFRKYSKWIMGILSIVLMFVFALPTFKGTTSRDADNAVVGYLGSRRIIHDDQQRASNELELIRRLMGGSEAYRLVATKAKEEGEMWLYWTLLKEEAKKYGSVIPSEASLQGKDLGGNSPHDVAIALADVDTVENYLNFLVKLPRPAAQVELEADKQLRKVKVWYLTLDAAKGWEQVADPTDAQIQTQYNTYKSVVHTTIPAPDAPAEIPPEKAGHHFPFGYKYPDQVEIEYVVFDHAAIEKLVTSKDDAAQQQRDRIEAYDKVFKLEEKYAGKKWEDVKDELIKAQVGKRVARRIKLMTDAFLERASKIEDTGGKVVYADLIKEISKTSEFMGYEPQLKTLPLMSAEELAKAPGIGTAWYHSDARNRDFPFSKLAVSLTELVKFDPNDPIGLLKPKVGVEGPLLVDGGQNSYVYRPIKAVPTHEPASVDEGGIRKQVVEDYKKAEAYKKNVERAKALAATARTTDIEELGKKENLPLSKPPEFTQVKASQYQSLTSAENRAAGDPKVIANYMTDLGLEPLKEVLSIPNMSQTAFTLASSSAPANGKRATDLEREDALRCYVVQIEEVVAATGEEFAKERLNLISQPAEGAVKFAQDYLSQAALENRLNWRKK